MNSIIGPPFASVLSSAKSPLPVFVFVGLFFSPFLASEWDFEKESPSI